MTVTILVSIACFIIGGFLSYMFFKHGLKSKYDNILKEAEAEAEVIKKNKLLEVKEKFLNKKADLEKEVAIRNQKIQQAENKLKQRELVLNQRQEEIQRKKSEAEAVKENLEAQLVIIDKKKDELDKLQQQEIEKLETISGLSADEAKERMIESLKEEAKTQAQSFINDIMDDAKLTASKEAKRLAKIAFAGTYEAAFILKWLKTFCRRFFAQQFKRSCLPDGPKVGSVAVSPRGDLRMPSDACATLWMEELNTLS